MAITHTKNYRIVTDRSNRSLSIQRAGTWAEVSTLRIPGDEPGLVEAVVAAIGDLAPRQDAVTPEPKKETPDRAPDPAGPKKPRPKKTPTPTP